MINRAASLPASQPGAAVSPTLAVDWDSNGSNFWDNGPNEHPKEVKRGKESLSTVRTRRTERKEKERDIPSLWWPKVPKGRSDTWDSKRTRWPDRTGKSHTLSGGGAIVGACDLPKEDNPTRPNRDALSCRAA